VQFSPQPPANRWQPAHGDAHLRSFTSHRREEVEALLKGKITEQAPEDAAEEKEVTAEDSKSTVCCHAL
jgi:hypothetical protein